VPIEKSEQINELAAALSKAQGSIKNAAKDSFNPHFKSKYADLASVIDATKEALAANGLAVSQMPEAVDGRVFITTMLLHSSGQWLSSTLMLIPDKTNCQGIGSAITYGRRYGMSAILGISQDDDDAEGAINRDQAPAKPRGDDTPYTATDAQKRAVMVWADKFHIRDPGELGRISARLIEGNAVMYELEEAIPAIVRKLKDEAAAAAT